MKTKVFIIAKTMPVVSRRYGKLICTAGVRKNGKLVRIYPVEFKKSIGKIFQWIKLAIKKDKSDGRSESYKINGNVKIMKKIDKNTQNKIIGKLLLKSVYFNKESLLKNKKLSLAIFKPSKIISFHIERNKDVKDKTPYSFYYKFLDNSNIITKLIIKDWRILQFTERAIKKYNANEVMVKKMIRKKYFCDGVENLHLILGTNRQWQIRKSKNPFMIIGMFNFANVK